MKLKELVAVTLLLVLGACYEINTIEGNYVLPEQIEKITLNTTTADEVFKLLGAPTFRSTFGDNVWFYSYEVYNRRLSFTNKIVKQYKTFKITFKNNKVVAINVTDMDSRKNIKINKNKTVNPIQRSNGIVNKVDKF